MGGVCGSKQVGAVQGEGDFAPVQQGRQQQVAKPAQVDGDIKDMIIARLPDVNFYLLTTLPRDWAHLGPGVHGLANGLRKKIDGNDFEGVKRDCANLRGKLLRPDGTEKHPDDPIAKALKAMAEGVLSDSGVAPNKQARLSLQVAGAKSHASAQQRHPVAPQKPAASGGNFAAKPRALADVPPVAPHDAAPAGRPKPAAAGAVELRALPMMPRGRKDLGRVVGQHWARLAQIIEDCQAAFPDDERLGPTSGVLSNAFDVYGKINREAVDEALGVLKNLDGASLLVELKRAAQVFEATWLASME